MADFPFSFNVRPHLVTSGVLVAASTVALVAGSLRERHALVREIPSLVWFAAVGLAFWPLGAAVRWGVIVVAAAAFVARLRIERTAAAESNAWRSCSRVAVAYLALALAISAVFLFYDLGGYAGSLMPWEGSTIYGFANAFRAGETAIDFARRQLIWNAGVLSAGDATLLYGAPTYVLLTMGGFSTWNLRLLSAIGALLAVLVSFFLARRAFGAIPGAATALAMAFSVSVPFHGRYGVAMSATFLTVLVALLCVWVFLDRERDAWWTGALAAGSLYLATLQYATGRIVVVLLVGFVGAYSVLRFDRLRWRRLLGLLSFSVVVVLLWQVQHRHGTLQVLLDARGEHFFSFADHPSSYEIELGRGPVTITWRDKLDLLRVILARTGPQYAALLAPSVADLTPSAAMASHGQVVHPYYAPLVAFLLLGLGCSLRSLSSWPHACLLLYTLGTSAALLLTTGVDAHRIAILSIPCALWIGLGVREGARSLARLRVPRVPRHVVALALCASCTLHLADQLYFPTPPQPEGARHVLKHTADVEGPIVVGSTGNPLELGWLLLHLLERARIHPGADPSLLDPRLCESIKDNREPSPEILGELIDRVRGATLVLVPAAQFQTVARELRRHGLTVGGHGTGGFHFFRIDRQTPSS